MDKLMFIPRAIRKLNKWISEVVKIALVVNLSVMVIIVFYSVISRSILNSSIAWAEELSRILFVWLVFTGAVLGLYNIEHLGLHILLDRLKPKMRNMSENISWVLVIVVAVAMIIGAYNLIDVVKNARTPALGISSAVKYLPVLIAPCLMVLISIEHLLDSIINLFHMFQTKKGVKE